MEVEYDYYADHTEHGSTTVTKKAVPCVLPSFFSLRNCTLSIKNERRYLERGNSTTSIFIILSGYGHEPSSSAPAGTPSAGIDSLKKSFRARNEREKTPAQVERVRYEINLVFRGILNVSSS